MGARRVGAHFPLIGLARILGIFSQILTEFCQRSSFPLEARFYDCLVTCGNAVAAGQQASSRS